MPSQDVLGDFLEADAADGRRGPREAGGDDFITQTECLEDLGPAVGGEGRDPHLRQDLEQSLLCSAPVAEPGTGGVQTLFYPLLPRCPAAPLIFPAEDPVNALQAPATDAPPPRRSR